MLKREQVEQEDARAIVESGVRDRQDFTAEDLDGDASGL